MDTPLGYPPLKPSNTQTDAWLEAFLRAPVGAPLSTETATPAMLAWLNEGNN